MSWRRVADAAPRAALDGLARVLEGRELREGLLRRRRGPRDGERDADAALVQGNIMRKTVHAVVRHNLQQMERRVEQNQQRVEQNQQRIERRIERIEALLEKLVSQG